MAQTQTQTRTQSMRIHVQDVSEQKEAWVYDMPPDSTVNELIEALVPQMKLPAHDTGGRPITYQARLDREGRALAGSERLDVALEPEDSLHLLPSVMAGGRQ